MKKNIVNLNTRFGDLVAVELLNSEDKRTRYLCNCDCGNTRIAKLTDLNKGIITHCGCKNFCNKHGNRVFSPTEASFRAKASNYKAGAKQRKIEFTLSLEETVDLLKQNCFYCGKIPKNVYNVRVSNRINKKNKPNYAYLNNKDFDILYNGIDRVDNNLGYCKGNVVTCCTQCNTAKLNFTEDEFKTWVIKVYENLKLNNYKK